jgi:hypothetical protein
MKTINRFLEHVENPAAAGNLRLELHLLATTIIRA